MQAFVKTPITKEVMLQKAHLLANADIQDVENHPLSKSNFFEPLSDDQIYEINESSYADEDEAYFRIQKYGCGLPDAFCVIANILIGWSHDVYRSKPDKWQKAWLRTFPVELIESISIGMEGYVPLYELRRWLLNNANSPLVHRPPWNKLDISEVRSRFSNTHQFDQDTEDLSTIFGCLAALYRIDSSPETAVRNLIIYYSKKVGLAGLLQDMGKVLVDTCKTA